MTPYYQTKSARLYLGDALEVMRTLPDDSIDSIVTDPPYFLTDKAGKGFMGKAWDSTRDAESWHREWATEALRVAKPGAHLVAFGGTRTYHRLACALEDAGWELRDTLAWVHGQGFPKSADISKHIDRAAGAEREVVGTKLGRPGVSKDGSNQGFEQWREVESRTDRPTPALAVTAPATDAARQWQGHGTALKPAFEPIVLARKPFRGNVAANVLEHGTGALNVDACRVEGAGKINNPGPNGGLCGTTEGWDRPWKHDPEMLASRKERVRAALEKGEALGRWPPNLLLSHHADCTPGECAEGCPVRALDEQSGELTSGGGDKRGGCEFFMGGDRRSMPTGHVRDSGGASRFFPNFDGVPWFYTAKASRGEREAGLDEKPKHIIGTLQGGGEGANDPVSQRFTKFAANTHPTVKPVDLMRWLVKLITPPKGTVLDCFMGSGSTAVAATHEGFSFIGIEREADYAEIAAHRLRDAVGPLFAKRPGATP